MAPIVAILLKAGLSYAAAAAATKGVDYLKEKTGVDLSSVKEELTPDEHLKISQAQEDNFEEWSSLQIRAMEHEEKLETIAASDRDSARKMQETALKSDSEFAKHFVYIFISAWSIFSMAFIILISTTKVDENSIRFVDTILGWVIGTAMGSIFAFLLGTTVRNSKKDDTINELVKGK